MPILPAILAASRIKVEPRSASLTEYGIVAEASPTLGSWWGRTVSIQLLANEKV